ncbi:MAG: SDR family NAD(P)-dependent oxidoreductase, partial [Candidatus Scalindua sp.]|nr:SDR family NAD(P)-dependent oxidoreductase [Candidatus Scalindua sp.]
MNQNILIIGATSAIAEAVARRYAEQGACLFLVARNTDKLQVISSDLSARGAKEVRTFVLDANDSEFIPIMLKEAWQAFGSINVALIAHGTLPDQHRTELEIPYAINEFRTNGELHFKTAPDFENPKDLGGTQIFDNIYDVTIQVSDSGVIPQSSHQSITVIILDSNDAPSFTTTSQLLVNENATFITKINAFDPDSGDVITYSLVNAGSSPAKINSSSGDLSLKQSF